MFFRLVRTAAVALTLLSAGTSVYAQGWARPAKTQNTDVVCATCPGTYKGKMTIGYSSPIKTYAGRFLDSQATSDYQQTFRTARATYVAVVPERKRIYMLIGSALAAYNTDTFFTRLEAGTPLSSAASAPVSPRNYRLGAAEEYLQWDSYFYAENGSGWQTPVIDGQDRLFGFDWDDRNLVYLGYSVFGWGIVKDNLGTGGTIMETVVQNLGSDGDLAPSYIMSVKAGSSYYALICEANNGIRTQVFNVTNPANPARMPDQKRGFQMFAKAQGGARIGVVDGDGKLVIHSAESMALGGQPLASYNANGGGRYSGIDSDGTNFYGVAQVPGQGVTISVITPDGSGYRESKHPTGLFYTFLPTIRYGGNFLTLAGYEAAPLASWNIRLYKLSNLVPAEVPMNNYIKNYYYSAPAGYVRPDPGYININDSLVYKHNSKYYLFVPAKGLGDVYELAGADSISVNTKRAGDATNPNAKTPVGGGPFYGDRFTFGSTASSSAVTPVNWDFGNPESSANNAGGFTGNDISHQYSGLTVLPATRQVTATASADAQVTGGVSVTLHKPTPRVGLKGSSTLFLQADPASTAAIVSSDEFIDASDGAIEGHFGTWTLDGTAVTKSLPQNAVSVGTCGSHSLRFDGLYGPYTGAGATLANTATPYTVTIAPIAYQVRPFAAAIEYVADATSVTFQSRTRVTTAAADLPQGAATSVTYGWELVNASGASILAGPTGTATLSQVPNFVVPKTTFAAQGIKARLTLTAASTVLGPACANLATSTTMTPALNGPDPRIDKTGCASVGLPCSFTANSVSGGSQDNWNYSWSVVGNASIPSGFSKDFTPAFTAAGTYTVRLTVTNAIGSSTLDTSATVAQPVCASNPTVNNVSIGYSSTTATCGNFIGSSCKPSETISFMPVPFGYVPDACDTYLWSFGDGSTSTAKQPTKSYSSTGTYNISLRITGGLNTATLTAQMTISSGVVIPPPPPPPPLCGTMEADRNIFIDFYNGPRTCTTNTGQCTTSDTVTFNVSVFGYNINCATHSYSWSFSNGRSGSGPTATNTFTQPGTYTATVDVNNGSQSVRLTRTITIVAGGSGNPGTGACPAMDAGRNVFIDFSNPSRSCTVSGGSCNTSENIAFNVSGFGYNFTCGTHTYAWRFGDGTTATGQAPTKSYSSGGDYTVQVDVNNGSQTITLSQVVKVTGGSTNPVTPIATANFTYEPFGSPTTLKFIPTATPATIVTKWNWTFGDGSTASSTGTTAVPQYHTYSASGTYTVTLSTGDATRTFAPVTKQVVVTSGSRGRAVRKW